MNMDTWLSVALVITGYAAMLCGLLGCVLPAMPGHLLIFLGCVCVEWQSAKQHEIGVIGWSVLVLLLLLSYVLNFLTGSLGARAFGASKWGMVGGTIGAIIGIFGGFAGILLGGVIGTIIAELFFSKKELAPAAKSGLGNLFGTLGSMIVGVVLGLVMIVYFLCDLYLVN